MIERETLSAPVISGRTTGSESGKTQPTALVMLSGLRPLHWIKNIFVFIPLIFSNQLFNFSAVIQSVVVFVLFCFSASAIYLINDLFDREEDNHHPVKKLRPVTSGRISPRQTVILSGILILLSLLSAFWINYIVWIVMSGYIVLNIVYSWVLKQMVVIDAMTIGLGFLLRIFAGSIVIQHDISYWVYMTAFFLSALIAFSKRRYEILFNGSDIRSDRGYSAYLLDIFMIFTSTSLFSSYVFYILFRSNWQNGWTIYLSILVVFFGITRYLYVIYQTSLVSEHTRLILSDKPLVISVVIWTILWITELYYINPHLTY